MTVAEGDHRRDDQEGWRTRRGMFLDNDGTLVLSTLTPPVSSATDGVTKGGRPTPAGHPL